MKPVAKHTIWGNHGYPHTWVMSPVSKIMAQLKVSMQKYPNIRPGQDFGGYDRGTEGGSR
jgi:hypothetical protein